MPIASPRFPRTNAVVVCFAVVLLAPPSSGAEPGWVAESSHFRVIAPERPGVDPSVARSAVEDLEAVRARALAEGLGSVRRADGPLELMVVATKLDLHSMLRELPGSRTRGITIWGLDRDFVIMPWHGEPGPRVTLAHEYAHQLEDRDWPLWFREGRAVYVARRTPLRSGGDPVHGMLEKLRRLGWLDWAELFAAENDGLTAESELFQTQSWLVVHWLVATGRSLARLDPEDAVEALARMGKERLTEVLRAHLEDLRLSQGDPPSPLEVVPVDVIVRPAAEWEIPLFAAEVSRDLFFLDSAEESLAALASGFPGVARVQAAYATLLQMLGRLDEAERHFAAAAKLGDLRARTAYRYALLLMRPGPDIEARTAAAERNALHARGRMPREPEHHLAVVQAKMLREDWQGAFESLRGLAGFPQWQRQAEAEAREIERRRLQSLRAVPPPPIVVEVSDQRVPISVPRDLPEWKASPARPGPAGGRRWPPYGSWTVQGRVAWVDCSGDVKKVVVHTPYSRIVMRVDPKSPPRLVNRPFKAKSLPCEARGWWAGFVYRKLPEESDFDADLLGVHF